MKKPSFNSSIPNVSLGLLTLMLLLFGNSCARLTIQGVVQGGQVVAGEVQGVTVIRKGIELPIKAGMALEVQDDLKTDANSTVVLKYQEGHRIIVIPNSHVKIGSLRVIIGQIYAKLRGAFEVQTEYVTAGVQGTEYLLTMSKTGELSVLVIEGRVVLTPRKGQGWLPVSVGKFQEALVLGKSAPKIAKADPAKINSIIQHVNDVERLIGEESTVLVPGVIGFSEPRAAGVLKYEGLSVETIGKVTKEHPRGTVLSQVPDPATRVSSASKVLLYIEREPTQVPNVIGFRIGDARELIQNRMLSVGTIRYQFTGTSPVGTVVSQDPEGNKEVAVGTLVELVIETDRVTRGDRVTRDEATQEKTKRRVRPQDSSTPPPPSPPATSPAPRPEPAPAPTPPPSPPADSRPKELLPPKTTPPPYIY